MDSTLITLAFFGIITVVAFGLFIRFFVGFLRGGQDQQATREASGVSKQAVKNQVAASVKSEKTETEAAAAATLDKGKERIEEKSQGSKRSSKKEDTKEPIRFQGPGADDGERVAYVEGVLSKYIESSIDTARAPENLEEKENVQSAG
ncbi:MAG: hypothetical protein QME63_08250 [Actinomycetota bacterium]|nr:hypothetical protein [Actinomycetota bacterium]